MQMAKKYCVTAKQKELAPSVLKQLFVFNAFTAYFFFTPFARGRSADARNRFGMFVIIATNVSFKNAM